jgi:hypothetical protein
MGMNAFPRMTIARSLVFITVCGAAFAGAGASLVAQTQSVRTQTIPDQGAEDVRDQFYGVLRQYSPTLGQILRLDPGLMAKEDYLAPYPAVSAFLKQHPEIQRNPDFYLNRFSGGSYYYTDPRERAWNNVVEMAGVFLIVLVIVGALGWTVRTAMDYRRWGRLSKIQAEAHTKLLDRFTGNEELLAYVQSPAGARFLKSSPISLDGSPRPMGSPIGRILFSMQAGLVLAAAGLGLNYVSHRIDPYHAEPVFMFSVLLLSVGIGFFGSAGLSFLMSRRLGLIGDAAGRDDES